MRATQKVMSVRASQFASWRNGQIVKMRGVLDSFDMVEQTLGRALDITPLELEPVPA